VGGEEQRFEIGLERGARIDVRRKRDPKKGLDWAVVLTVKRDGQRHAVYLYDTGPRQFRPEARLDLPAAIKEIKARWEGMVERWEQ
jgi:hypothetical protein